MAIKIISMSELRQQLKDILATLEATGEPYFITQYSRPKAVLSATLTTTPSRSRRRQHILTSAACQRSAGANPSSTGPGSPCGTSSSGSELGKRWRPSWRLSRT